MELPPQSPSISSAAIAKDLANECYEYNFPWPIIQIARCKRPNIEKYIFFPFYGFYKYENKIIKFIGPLYFSIDKYRRRESVHFRFFFPIYTYFRKDILISENKHRKKTVWIYRKIFPLFSVERKEENYAIQILSIWPFYDPDFIEPLLAPYFTLFYYRVEKSGFRIITFLFRIISFYGKDGYTDFEFFPIVRWGRSKNKAYLFFIFDAFGYYEDEKVAYIRIFWFPVYLRMENKNIIEKKYFSESIYNTNKYFFFLYKM